jgi:hypothetical protein
MKNLATILGALATESALCEGRPRDGRSGPT